MYIVVYFIFVYSFTEHCHRVDTQLQLVSYHISHHILNHNISYNFKYPEEYCQNLKGRGNKCSVFTWLLFRNLEECISY